MKDKHSSEEEMSSEELNDKLNDLWTGSKNRDKRKKWLKNLTPSHSRRSDQSELNTSSQLQQEQQLLRIRDKLAYQVTASKHKDLEIESLKKALVQLNNDKKMLLSQLYGKQEELYGKQDENSAHTLNQSSINCARPGTTNIAFQTSLYSQKAVDGNTAQTANFSSIKKGKRLKQGGDEAKHRKEQSEHPKLQQGSKESVLEDVSKNRLITLLRSTSEYRQFVFYYDSHQLSYLKRLHSMHKKNCGHSYSEKERRLWAPTELLLQLQKLNQEEAMGLDERQIELLLSTMKQFYQSNEEQRVMKIKEGYEEKMRRAQRENHNSLPYELVQVCKAKERQLAKQLTRKRTNTLK